MIDRLLQATVAFRQRHATHGVIAGDPAVDEAPLTDLALAQALKKLRYVEGGRFIIGEMRIFFDDRAIITNTPHNTDEACAIVRNLISLVEGQQVAFVAALFRSIWGAEPGRLPYFNRPSFFGEVLCCWRPRWIPDTKKSPMHAYAWYV